MIDFESENAFLDSMQDLIRQLLQNLGEDPDREGLLKTPERVERSLKFLTKGYEQDPKDVINGAIFSDKTDEMIVVRDISFYSLCEHHLLPFFGKCHVAYIPKQHIVGLSKISRLVDVYARRLQVQERMTTQISQTIQDELNPLGVAVVVEAQHLCMAMRGVQKGNSTMVTSSMLGAFRNHEATRLEFLNMIHRTS